MKNAVMELTALDMAGTSGAVVPLSPRRVTAVSERLPRIPNFHLVECCGRGGFGAVYLGIDRDGVRRAIRVVRRNDPGSPAECESASVAAYRNLASGHDDNAFRPGQHWKKNRSHKIESYKNKI